MTARDRQAMQPWLIPMVYVIGAVIGGIALPRIEHAWRMDVTFEAFDLSVSSAQAFLSAAASGMMALTGIVFAMGFVMVQFSAIAYSPRVIAAVRSKSIAKLAMPGVSPPSMIIRKFFGIGIDVWADAAAATARSARASRAFIAASARIVASLRPPVREGSPSSR